MMTMTIIYLNDDLLNKMNIVQGYQEQYLMSFISMLSNRLRKERQGSSTVLFELDKPNEDIHICIYIYYIYIKNMCFNEKRKEG